MANRLPKSVSVRVRGRVQGVGYRDWTIRRARALGLTGWVRNCRDGSVEALFVGGEAEIAEMLSACRTGPTIARVDQVDERPAEAPGPDQGSAGFRRLPTA